MQQTRDLTNLIQYMCKNTEGKKVDLVTLLETLNARGFGPLLAGPSIITIMPTGAIPGVPAFCALLIILVCAQILLGNTHPWVPKKVRNFSFSRDKFLHYAGKCTPYTQFIDKLIYPRMSFLVKGKAEYLVALICILLAISIIILGFIPFAALIPASGVLLLGLSLMGRDGLLFIIALLFAAASLALAPYGISKILG
jgi:hypothetical protein